MKILFTGQSAEIRRQIPGRNSLEGLALKNGHTIAQHLEEKPDVLICMDWNRSSGSLVRRANTLGVPTTLVKGEPSIVVPGHLSSEIDGLFQRVIELGRPMGKPVVRYPINWDVNFFDNSLRLHRAVAVSANKFSFVSGELYSLRAEAYSKLDSLDLFGVGWDRSLLKNAMKMGRELQIASNSKFTSLTYGCAKSLKIKPLNYLGQSANKLHTISKYRVSLVIENSTEYMSEKLMDSILAGAIPVYVGPPVEAFEIPPDLVISADSNFTSIKVAIDRALQVTYKGWHELAREWLQTPGVREKWDIPKVNNLVLRLATLEA